MEEDYIHCKKFHELVIDWIKSFFMIDNTSTVRDTMPRY
jgi:hypothetical protein